MSYAPPIPDPVKREAVPSEAKTPRLAQDLPQPAVLGQLERVLASPQLSHSDRLTRLLRFVVSETLAGRAGELKETRLGLAVLERPVGTYDPAIDPIVRVQMGRLRKRLADYYQNQGAADPLLIEVPRGRYAPRFTWRSPGRASGAPDADSPVERLAVLPFVDMSGDPENAYFGDGLTEELINALARERRVQVVARTSTFQFKGVARDVRDIGRQLGVGRVLEGSVRRSGNRVRVTAQLVDVADGCHLWSERYERELTEIFAIQDEVVASIQDALRARLAGEGRGGARPDRSVRVDAYQHCLQGRYHWNRRSEGGLRAGLEHFREAVRLEPGYARAHSGLADCHLMLGMSAAEAPERCMPEALAAATRALELDEGLAEAQGSLAAVRSCYLWDWSGADAAYRRALSLDAGYATAHHWYGLFRLAPAGRLAEACEELERAIELDPLSKPILADRALLSCFGGEHAAASDQARKALDLDPHFHRPYWFLGLCLTELGEHPEAVAALRRGLELCEGRAFRARLLGALGHAHARAGDGDRAREVLGELRSLGDAAYAPSFELAQVHAGLGDASSALISLERAVEARGSFAIFLGVWPAFEPLRSEPRFQALLSQLGFGPGEAV